MANKRATNAGWSAPAPADVVYRRAGGRRRYNAQRRLAALIRRVKLAHLLVKEMSAVVVPEIEPDNLASIDRALKAIRNRGAQARIARELGVSRSTVCRDRMRLFRELGIWPAAQDPMCRLLSQLAELWSRDSASAGIGN
jgi:hypothetical protein